MLRINTLRPLLPLVVALPLLGGCVPALLVTGATGTVISYHDRRSTGTQIDDETTEWRARNRVPGPYRDSGNINFTAFNRTLLISGEVGDESAKLDIGEMARQIDGVGRVHNELQIGPPSSLPSRSNDVFISSKYKTRLLDSGGVSSNHIKPVTESGVLFLMGIVNEREAKAAIDVARTTSGVRKVVNLLEVVPPEETRRLDDGNFGSRERSAPSPAR